MIYLFLFLLLFALQLLYFKIADKFNIIDKPNLRSSHTEITLRGGGIIFYLGALLYFFVSGFDHLWFIIGLTLISLISFADDIKPQSPKIRLVIQFVAILFMFYEWQLFEMAWYFSLIALVICVGILNAYNFMDGINGITGSYSLVVLSAFWYINNYIVGFIDNQFLYILALSVLVFNIFNFRTKAKCFAGDIGAVSIAFIILFLLGLLILKTGDFSYITLLLVYGVDTVLTILHRMYLKENITQPHRKHVFQLLANELKWPHLLVSTVYAVLQFCIAVGLFVFKSYSYWYTLFVIIVLTIVYVSVKVKYFYLHKH